MRADWLGERSLVIRELDESPEVVATKLLERLPGLHDAVPCYQTVGLYFHENVPSLEQLDAALVRPLASKASQHLVIPVCYELGEDFAAISQKLQLTRDELIALHSRKNYRCAAVGFVPGFAYLGELDSRIATLSRLPSPRIRVTAGSVAIAGKQTAIYPQPTPGGWWLVGQTPLVVAEEASGYFPISPGDQITFKPIDQDEFKRLEGQRL